MIFLLMLFYDEPTFICKRVDWQKILHDGSNRSLAL